MIIYLLYGFLILKNKENHSLHSQMLNKVITLKMTFLALVCVILCTVCAM